MAVVGTEALAVGGEPGADYLVFGSREEDITVFGVPERQPGSGGSWTGRHRNSFT